MAQCRAQVMFYALQLKPNNIYQQQLNENLVSNLTHNGYSILYTSGWLNTVVAYRNDLIKPIPEEVLSVVFIDSIAAKDFVLPSQVDTNYSKDPITIAKTEYENEYGFAYVNSNFLGLEELHKRGFNGKDISIAVFDGGFTNVQRLACFDSIYNEHRFGGIYNLSLNKNNAYKSSQHGTLVLGCMAANIPFIYKGTATGARYTLFVTETTHIETPLEEWAYAVALEKAYFLGIKLVQCSLGYTQFDHNQLSHNYADLENQNLPILKAIKIAVDKGMILVNSAGNEGDNIWHYVGIPSASPHVICVGAAEKDGVMANFSSWGKSKTNIKPNTVGIGYKTHCLNSNGYMVQSNGTSFAAPTVAGAIACLMQLIPNKDFYFYKDMVQAIGKHAIKPDSQGGYGQPNFGLCLFYTKIMPNMEDFPFFTNQINSDTMKLKTDIKGFEKANCLIIKNEKHKRIFKNKVKKINSLAYGTTIELTKTGTYEVIFRKGLKKWRKNVYFVQ